MLLRSLLFIILAYCLLVAAVYALQKYIIFQPDQLTQNYKFQFDIPFKEQFLKTSDGDRLNVLFFPTSKIKKGIVFYFHGNSDNLQRWGQYQSDFTKRGYDVLTFDYRGYGKSSGELSEINMYKDALLIYQNIREKYNPEEIIIYGRSLGSAVASQLATQVKARRLILETPFDNITNVLKRRIPVLFFPFDFDYKFPNDEYLLQIDYPICIFHGTEDHIVPYECAKHLESCLKKTDEFITIEGGGHKNLNTFDAYHKNLDRLLGINEFAEE